MSGRKKTFKSLDEQVEILKNKGLTIKDVENAKNILFKENYFFISGYRHLFMKSYKSDIFIPGTTFDELYATFVFDRNVRNIMFKNILIIENNVKSVISYQLSKNYGYKEKEYLDPKNFTQDPMRFRHVKDVLEKMKRQIRVNGKQHAATMHYLNNYGYVPMWILVKVLSFGIISELYSILKEEDQQAIANIYNLDIETMSIYLSLLANFRNLCAHEDILYDHRTQRSIPDTKYHYMLKIDMTDDEYLYGKNDLYALVIILKRMLSENQFHDIMNEINYEVTLLDAKVDAVPLTTILNKIGFPHNWNDIEEM